MSSSSPETTEDVRRRVEQEYPDSQIEISETDGQARARITRPGGQVVTREYTLAQQETETQTSQETTSSSSSASDSSSSSSTSTSRTEPDTGDPDGDPFDGPDYGTDREQQAEGRSEPSGSSTTSSSSSPSDSSSSEETSTSSSSSTSDQSGSERSEVRNTQTSDQDSSSETATFNASVETERRTIEQGIEFDDSQPEAVQAQAREFERSIVEENPNLTIGGVAIQREGDQLVPALTSLGERQLQEQAIAQEIGVDPEAIDVQPGEGDRTTVTARTEQAGEQLTNYQRERAAEQLSEQNPGDYSAEDVRVTDSGIELTEPAQQERAERQIAEEYQGLTAEDFEAVDSGDGFQIEPASEAAREQLRIEAVNDRIRQEFDEVQDVDIERTSEGVLEATISTGRGEDSRMIERTFEFDGARAETDSSTVPDPAEAGLDLDDPDGDPFGGTDFGSRSTVEPATGSADVDDSDLEAPGSDVRLTRGRPAGETSDGTETLTPEQQELSDRLEADLERQVGAEELGEGRPRPEQLDPERFGEQVDLDRGEDFTVSFEGDGATAEFTDEFLIERAQPELEAQVRQAGLAVDLSEDDLQVDDSGTVGLSESGEETVQEADRREQFGDFRIEVPFTGGETVEDYLEAGAEAYSEALESGATNAEGPISVSLETAGLEDESDTVQEIEQSTIRGVGWIANLPATALGLKEGLEFVSYGAQQSAPEIVGGEGRGEEFAAEAGEAGAEAFTGFVNYAQENPVEVTAAGAGALLGSYGIIRGASSVSARAGRGAAYAIQPGEELIGGLGNRATRLVASERAAERLFPNSEPLIFSEEAAIRGGRRLAGSTRATVTRARRLARGDFEVGDVSPTTRARLIATRDLAPEPSSGSIELETETEDVDLTELDVDDVSPQSQRTAQQRAAARERFRGQDETTGTPGEISSRDLGTTDYDPGVQTTRPEARTSSSGSSRSEVRDMQTNDRETSTAGDRSDVDINQLDEIAAETAGGGGRRQLREAAEEIGVDARVTVAELRERFGGRTYSGVPVPVSRTEVDTETETGTQTDAVDPELREQALEQYRMWAEAAGRRELEARREQLADTEPRRPETEIERRRRRATEPSVGTETETESRTGFEPRTELGIDSGTETVIDGASSRLEAAQASTVRPGETQLPGEDVTTEPVSLSTELETELERLGGTEIELRTETGIETELESLTELETEIGTRLETEVDQRFSFDRELESEFEFEDETELEAETEFEFEDELEAEGARPDEDDDDRRRRRFGFDIGSELTSTGIASVDELLDGGGS